MSDAEKTYDEPDPAIAAAFPYALADNDRNRMVFSSGYRAGRASRDAEVAEAEAVILAIVDATSGPGDGPSPDEMVTGVADALSLPAAAATRAKFDALRAEVAELHAAIEKVRALAEELGRKKALKDVLAAIRKLPINYGPIRMSWLLNAEQVLAAIHAVAQEGDNHHE